MPTYCEPKNHDGIKVDDIAEKTTSHGIEVHNEIKIDTITELTPNNGVVIDSVTIKDGGISSAAADLITSGNVQTDTIIEKTAANGVNVDSVVLKDGGLTATGDIDTSGSVTVDTINEHTSGAGVTIDGTLIKDKSLSIDTISEDTATNGVNIESVSFKDSTITLANNAHLSGYSTGGSDYGILKLNSSDEIEFNSSRTTTKSSHTTAYYNSTGTSITPVTTTFEEWLQIGDQVFFQLVFTYDRSTVTGFGSGIYISLPKNVSSTSSIRHVGRGIRSLSVGPTYQKVDVYTTSSANRLRINHKTLVWPGGGGSGTVTVKVDGQYTSV